MLLLRPLTRLVYVLSFSQTAASEMLDSQSDDRKPIYAIAHRVLRPESVTAAIEHGANALEVDLTAWHFEWWADHDGKLWSSGSMARELFQFIAQQQQNGGNIAFVWLDIKNPDYCENTRRCSIEGLQSLVREILEPVGLRALYGFFETEDSRGYRVVRDSLNENEAVCLSGKTNDVLDFYDSTAGSVPAAQRVMDYGNTDLGKGFGNCHGEGDNANTCTELRKGSEASTNGKLGKVMGWTSGQDDTQQVDKMLGEAGVDGIIYGFPSAEYEDEPATRAAFQDIMDFVNSHSDTHRMANRDDAPW